MSKPKVLLLNEIEDNTADLLGQQFPAIEFIDAREDSVRDDYFARAEIIYGLPPIKRLQEAEALKWIQLVSAGVPRSLCAKALEQNIVVTSLTGLYGPSIAEHTLTLMSMLCRNLHVALRNQHNCIWDQAIARTMTDLSGQTVAIIGLGDIGRAIARLAKAFGMRVVGCRRTCKATPFVDRVYPVEELLDMLAEGDFVVVAVPLTAATTGWLGDREFAAMKPGAWFINISRGKVTDEAALLDVLNSGHIIGAGLDVFAVEPLPEDHPFWSMPNVIISPHYSGDTVNHSSIPLERFKRNLQARQAEKPLEGRVHLTRGY